MSYDLMVFAPDAAPPKKRGPFLDWYEQQSAWEEDHSYDNPAVCAPALRAFYEEIAQTFPPQREDHDAGTDYTIGTSVIYMTFGCDSIDAAYEMCFS